MRDEVVSRTVIDDAPVVNTAHDHTLIRIHPVANCRLLCVEPTAANLMAI